MVVLVICDLVIGGWFSDKEFTKQASAGEEIFENITLYAEWEEIQLKTTSEKYQIDQEKLKIKGIQAKTTVALVNQTAQASQVAQINQTAQANQLIQIIQSHLTIAQAVQQVTQQIIHQVAQQTALQVAQQEIHQAVLLHHQLPTVIQRLL